MRMIGTAVAIAAALMMVTAGVADAKGKRHHGGKTYKFSVECPVISPMPWTKGTCSAKGANMDAARATCQMQNQLCYIRNVGKKKHK
jgi:hypothetical protein